MGNETIKELEIKLQKLKKEEEENKKIQQAEINQKMNQIYQEYWTDEKFKKLLKKCDFSLERYNGINLLCISREYFFGDDWDDTFCQIKNNVLCDEYYELHEMEFEIQESEIELLIKKIQIFLNDTIRDIISKL